MAREIFGMHHSDIDDTVSSESEDGFMDGTTAAPLTSKHMLRSVLSVSSESSDAEQSV